MFELIINNDITLIIRFIMKYRSYQRDIESATAQMLDLFNDIVIDRRTPNNTVQKTFKVNCLYESRSRILKQIENRSNTMSLPLISISIGSISRDTSRVFDIHNGLVSQTGSTYDYLENTPVPINITYNVTVYTKYTQDMEQILSNWIVFFNPDVYIVIPNPVTKDKLKIQVVWDGNVNINFNDEVSKEETQIITSSSSFTVKTYMFPGTTTKSTGKIIEKINFTPNIIYDERGTGYLNSFYSVPNNISFDTFQENVVCGMIKTGFDWLPVSGDVSGYFYPEISARLTGSSITPELTSNRFSYLYDSGEDQILIVANSRMPEGTASVDYNGWSNYPSEYIG